MSLHDEFKFDKFSGTFVSRHVSTTFKASSGVYSGTTSSGQHVTVYGPAQAYEVIDGDSFQVQVLLDERTPSKSIGHKTDIRNDPDNGVSLLDVFVPHTFDGDDLRKRDAVDVWLMQRESVGRSMFMFLVNKSQRYARLTTKERIRMTCERVVKNVEGSSFEKSVLLRYLALVVLWIILSAGPDDSAFWNAVVLLTKPAVMFVLAIAVALKLFGKNGLSARMSRYDSLRDDTGVSAMRKGFIVALIFGYMFLFMFGWSPLVSTPHVYAPSVFVLAVLIAMASYLSKWERASRELATHLNQEMLALIQEKYGDLRIIQEERAA